MSVNSLAVRLSQVAELNPRPSTALNDDVVVSFLSMSAVAVEGTTSEGDERRYAEVNRGYTVFEDGDILIAKITPCFENGKIAQATLNNKYGVGSTEFHVVRPNHERLDSRYLLHFLRQTHVRLDGTRRMTGSAGHRRVPVSFFSDLEVLLPSLSEQKRIGAILDMVESIRIKRRATIEKIDQLAQAVFIEMFGDLIKNPLGWIVRLCREVCDRITVGIVVQPSSYYRDNGIPALRSLNIKPNDVVLKDLVYFSEEDNRELEKTRVWEGDVVVVRTGQPGTAAVIPSFLDGVNAIDILIVTPDKEQVDARYLSFFFNSSAGKSLVLGQARGQIQQHLNVGSLKLAEIPIPPLALQNEFARRWEKLESIKKQHCVHLKELDALYSTLQHRAFRGEL